MPTLPGPQTLEITPVTACLHAYRVVGPSECADPALLDSFKSNHDLGRPERTKSPEATYRAIWHGISVYEELAQAASTARVWPRLGLYVAHLILPPGEGFSVARWGPEGHMSAWGDPASFLNAVADIVAVNTVEVDTQ